MAMTQVKLTALLRYLHAVVGSLWAFEWIWINPRRCLSFIDNTEKPEVPGRTHDAYFPLYKLYKDCK
jgi:hypothetical protein